MSDFDPEGLHMTDDFQNVPSATVVPVDVWQPTNAIMWRDNRLYQLWHSITTGKRELRPVPGISQADSMYGLGDVTVVEGP
jgi:hypothetical protein